METPLADKFINDLNEAARNHTIGSVYLGIFAVAGKTNLERDLQYLKTLYEGNDDYFKEHGKFLGKPPKNMFGYVSHPEYRLYNHNSIKKSNTYSAPTQSFLQQWLREQHNIHIELIWDLNFGVHWYCVITKIGDLDFEVDLYDENLKILTAEDALEQGLIEALKLI